VNEQGPIVLTGRSARFVARADEYGLPEWAAGAGPAQNNPPVATDRGPGNRRIAAMIDTSPPTSQPRQRFARACESLLGLSVGDAFGDCFFHLYEGAADDRALLNPPWRYTDDTVMASAIVDMLEMGDGIEQASLAYMFARRYRREPWRGYGAGAGALLRSIDAGADWRETAASMFGGTGSMGNGGAMRVAPLGAYYADDLDVAVAQARLSAEVTHTHPEGIAGAVAVAIAAATVRRTRHLPTAEAATLMLETAHRLTPAGEVRDGIARAIAIPRDMSPSSAAGWLGNGGRITAPDTVPFCLWQAARRLDDYVEALWETVGVRGDIDTNAAIVGGIVVGRTGTEAIPAEWLAAAERPASAGG